MEGGDGTFRANFTTDGFTRLRHRVADKLKEFMGDYTDDTLVEYVIVLLKNGRRKDEAKTELDVFLGDDSDSFVTWLWDHLDSNQSLYVQPCEPHQDGDAETKSAAEVLPGKSESHANEEVNSKKVSKSHHNRDWKGLMNNGDDNDAPPLESSVAEDANAHHDSRGRVSRTKQPLSPQRTIQKKRRRSEERQLRKSEISQKDASAPRRLLQSALRDAAATSRPSNTKAQPSLKRLRSVVATPAEDSLVEERPKRVRPAGGLRTAMSTAIKAVAEAAKDVRNVRPSRNVFDRLGHATGVPNTTKYQENHEGVDEAGVSKDYSDGREDIHFAYQIQNDSYKRKDEKTSSFHDCTIMTLDLGYEGEGHHGVSVMSRDAIDVPQPGRTIGNLLDEPLIFPSNEADVFDEQLSRPHRDLDQPAAYSITSSVKINNQTTDKYRNAREVADMDDHKSTQDSGNMGNNSKLWPMKENGRAIVDLDGDAQQQMAQQTEQQKSQTPTGLYSTGPPTDEGDSRTIFVSNVHFAATKDGLSRHFNKVGEVLKVIILTEPATGQPKGSAYIEFMRKEEADRALSLDGTSFMSRILKIVRKGSAQPEAAPSAMAWPRVARASPYAVSRFSRAPFARGVPSLYRGRTPVKQSGRSFQWKREAQPAGTEASTQALNSIAPPSASRSLTYVRTEPKVEAK